MLLPTSPLMIARLLRQQGAPTFAMAQERFRLQKSALRATKRRKLHLLGIPFIRLLRGVCVACCTAARLDRGYVDVLVGRVRQCVLSDLVIVEGKSLSRLL